MKLQINNYKEYWNTFETGIISLKMSRNSCVGGTEYTTRRTRRKRGNATENTTLHIQNLKRDE
jgi:hypothetical protein